MEVVLESDSGEDKIGERDIRRVVAEGECEGDMVSPITSR